MSDVLVAGAGPTGLMAACELARRGVRVRVIDAAPGPSTASRGKGLQPRTLEILDGLGIAERLVATGRFRLPLRRYDGEGGHEDHDTHPGAEPTPDSPYARTLMLPQWRVEETLREHVTALGTPVEWGTAVTGLTQDDDGVTVTLADGSTERARYVIGCDGGSGAVRGLLGVRFLGETHEDVRMLLGDVRLDGLDRDHWHQWAAPTRPFLALCPLPATDAFQFQAALMPGDPAEPSLAAFQAIVDEVTPGVRLREATWLSRWRLNVRMVDRYRVGRVFLAGDAAHVHSPAGAQGMNTGIQDSANLGWKLAAVLGGADPTLLDTYEAERLPVAAAVLGLSTRLTGQRFERRGSDGVQAMQLGITYRGGPLAPEWAGDGPHPGDRAPDAPCRRPDGSRVRLFDLQRGGHWTLYGFGVRPQAHGPMRAFEIGGEILDADGHARQAYAATDGDLVLVRPDGHVALRTTDPEEITRYLPSREFTPVRR